MSDKIEHTEFTTCQHPSCLELKERAGKELNNYVTNLKNKTYSAKDQFTAVEVASDRTIVGFKLNSENLKSENKAQIEASLMSNLRSAVASSDLDYNTKTKEVGVKLTEILKDVQEKYGDDWDDTVSPRDLESNLN
jgi:hypothetical protein